MLTYSASRSSLGDDLICPSEALSAGLFDAIEATDGSEDCGGNGGGLGFAFAFGSLELGRL